MQQSASVIERSSTPALPVSALHARPSRTRRRRTDGKARSRRRCERLFHAELPAIRRLTASVARQHGLAPVDAEDFTADVMVRLMKNDYAILRKFRSRCSLHTFLAVVINRLFLDFRNALWGKWRPCAESRRLGDTAVRFERLTGRDGLTFDEACAVLETNYKRTLDRRVLERVYSRSGKRPRPRFVSADDVCERAASGSGATANETLVVSEAQTVVNRTRGLLGAALAAMDYQDRSILTLHFRDGLSIADIARRLGVDQKPLYRQMERLLRQLRASLEAHGIGATEVFPALLRNETDPGGLFPPEDRCLTTLVTRSITRVLVA